MADETPRLRIRQPIQNGLNEIVGADEMEYLGFSVVALNEGERASIGLDGEEAALVILTGTADIAVAGGERYSRIGGRVDVFSANATTVYVPCGHEATISAAGPGPVTVAVCRAKTTQPRMPALIAPHDVRTKTVGRANWKRAVRDIYTTDVDELLIDSEEDYKKVRDFMKITMPRQRKSVGLYSEPEPLFHRFGLEEEIQKVYRRQVQLDDGGAIVIDQTEALVAIDVNSGKYVKEASIEETAYRTNMAAANEIARQLRLRDLGGVMAIDFIDMEDEKHRHDVEQALWNGLRRDRARVKMLRMSRFGIVEMTRQRMRESLERSHFENCPYCTGTGRIKRAESVGLDAFRSIRSHTNGKRVGTIQVSLSPKVADYLQNEKRADLVQIEAEAQVDIEILAVPDMSVESIQIQLYDREGRRLKK